MKHYFIRKFIPGWESLVEGNKTSIPKKIWATVRGKRKRNGQLTLDFQE